MHQLTNKQHEEYQRLCHARDHGQILTPDGLRLVCTGFDYEPEAIGKHMLETLAKIQSKENKNFEKALDRDKVPTWYTESKKEVKRL